MSKFFEIFGFKSKKNSQEQRSMNCHPIYGNGMGFSFGGFGHTSSAMNLPTFFRATDLISSNIAMMPIEIKRKGVNAENHPLNLVFNDRDGGLINRFNALKLIVQSIILKGNSYVYIERAEDGTPIRLRTLESGDVTVFWNKERYELYYQCPLVSRGRISPKDMLHFKMWSFNGVEGVSLIKFMANALGIATNTENSASSYYAGNMTPSAILSVQGPNGEAQRQQIRESWNQSSIGNGGSGVAVLPSNITYTQISQNAEEAQLLQNRQFNALTILQFFGINPVMMGILDHSSYGTIESVMRDFVSNCLSPYVVMLEQELNAKLVKENERGVTINLNEKVLLLTDKAASANYYSSLVNNGILSRNEARYELNYAPIEGGDDIIIPYTKVEDNTIGNKSQEESKDDKADDLPQEEKKSLRSKNNKVKKDTK